jgi:membrane-bound serine protease (ClpP class)
MNRFIFFLFFATSSLAALSQASKVLILNIQSSIDARTSRYVELGLEKAHTEAYDLVLVDMNTYGGTVFDGDKIVSMFLDEPLPIYIYIDKNAGSAGSYIAISCDSIFMAPGSIMGASTVVNENMDVLSEKIQSAMRSKMRTTAQTQGRNPVIAEEFVGKNLHSDSSFVRVLTNKEALEVNYCEGVFETKEQLFNKYGYQDATIDTFELDATNQLIDFFLNPAVKSLLILLIFGGIYMEIKTPGIGIAALISLSATLLYFIPDYMHGLLANWEILLFIIGVILIVLEVFVIPGFGIAGVSGIMLIFTSLLLSMIQNDFFDFEFVGAHHLNVAFRTVAIGFIGSMVFLYFTASLLIKSKAFERIALTDSINVKVNTSSSVSSLQGKIGVAFTVLRPSGKVKIDDKIYDATSRGSFIDKNENIIVIEDENSSLKVKKA